MRVFDKGNFAKGEGFKVSYECAELLESFKRGYAEMGSINLDWAECGDFDCECLEKALSEDGHLSPFKLNFFSLEGEKA